MEIPFEISLEGKTIVITGGGGVLCSTFAKALARCGANIALLDIKLASIDAVAEQINSQGGHCIAVAADVLDRGSLDDARRQVHEVFGSCDILINGAGGNHPGGTTTREYLFPEDLEDGETLTSFFDLRKEAVEFVFDLNFLGTLLPTQVFAKDMVSKTGCSIVNISSMNAFCPLTKIPAYSAAKAAISNFTQWLAVHFSKVGIRVNAIAPGFFITAQNHDLLVDKDGHLTERAEKIIRQTPMNRFGNPEELLGTLFFLVSQDAASFVNGVVIPVDGGFSAYSGV